MTRSLFFLAGFGSALIGVLHVVIVFVGGPGYRYFGAGEEMAQMTESGSWIPAVVTLTLSTVFFVFAAYAWSAGRFIRRLPVLRIAVLCIGAVYFLRGLSVVLDLGRLLSPGSSLTRWTLFSAIALAIGLLYLVPTLMSWKALTPVTRPETTTASG